MLQLLIHVMKARPHYSKLLEKFIQINTAADGCAPNLLWFATENQPSDVKAHGVSQDGIKGRVRRDSAVE